MVPPVPMRTILGRPSWNSTGDSFFSRTAGWPRTSILVSGVTETPTLYPLLTFRISTSGELNS